MSTAQSDTKPTIVLIHGAFADGTSWQHVIPLLEQNGYSVLAVQIPLSSVPDDVATTKRAIDFVKGPVVLVGHSYGGVVITGAGAGAPNVKALVYIAAYARRSTKPSAPRPPHTRRRRSLPRSPRTRVATSI